MTHHLVLGAGPVGRATAALLSAHGHDVLLASRSGTGPAVAASEPLAHATAAPTNSPAARPGDGSSERTAGSGPAAAAGSLRRVAVDAADTAALTRLATGAAAVYNCLNPAAYHRWPQEWPPMAAAILDAAAAAGAVLVTTSNLYAYGAPRGPLTAADPDRPTEAKGAVRARMWADALAAHEAGRVRAAEVRASDYVGRGVGAGGHLTRQVPALRRGGTAWVLGDPDQPHSWTDVADVARCLVTVAADPAAHGRTWIAPTGPPRTQREGLGDLARALGVDPPRVRAVPGPALAAAGLAVPMLREVHRIDYQFTAPFVVDSTETEKALGLSPTPWERSCAYSVSQA